MAIVKMQFDGVGANRFYLGDVDSLFARLQHFLTGPVAAYLGRGRVHPQVLTGQHEMAVVIKLDFERTRALV
jgi:hypothetical protein